MICPTQLNKFTQVMLHVGFFQNVWIDEKGQDERQVEIDKGKY